MAATIGLDQRPGVAVQEMFDNLPGQVRRPGWLAETQDRPQAAQQKQRFKGGIIDTEFTVGRGGLQDLPDEAEVLFTRLRRGEDAGGALQGLGVVEEV